jgi:threonine synthase
LLAETEGIFTEPAGGTTLAATIQLIERGMIPRDESIVVGITGNGYKTGEVVRDRVMRPVELGRSLQEFEGFLNGRTQSAVASQR